MKTKKQIEEIIRDIEIEPAWNTGFSGCAEHLNDKSVENAIDKIIQIKNLSERSEPPHPLLCADCAFWEPDSEYAGLGNCSNDETMNRLIFGHADMFLISNDFGCINHKRK